MSGRKGTSWSQCPLCDYILSDKDLKKHERDQHPNITTPDSCSSELSTPAKHRAGHVTPRRESSSSILSCSTVQDSYGYIDKGVLHAVISQGNVETEPSLPSCVKETVVYLSVGTMRVCKIQIGQRIVINNQFCYTAWPSMKLADCHAVLPTRARLSMDNGIQSSTLCEIRALGKVPTATRVIFALDQQSDDQAHASSIITRTEQFVAFLRQSLAGRCLCSCSGTSLTVQYFGKPICLSVNEVTGSYTDQLATSLEELNLSQGRVDNGEVPEQITSTPAKPARINTASVGPENGLALTTAKIYAITQSTSVSVKSEQISETPTSTSTLPVLAGMDSLLASLNELIAEPISKAGHYRKYGVSVPKGVLLYGPSGCGKSLIAQTIGAKLTGLAQFITLDSSSLWSKQFGETESRLQKIFQDAVDRSPSVICIDDIDVMCPRRERSQSDLEKRVLSSLVMEIDKVTQKEGCYVFILATTNKLDSVDMVLRRPGRIDREIEVPVPTSTQRSQMLRAMLAPMLHKLTDDELTSISSDCHGYVGADLHNLCREAGLVAMRKARDEGVCLEDMRSAMAQVQPSAMREIYIDIPKVRWTDIGGQQELKKKLIQAIIWPLTHADKFTRLGIKPPRGVLMYGPPGCSKTMIAKALATETSLNFISIKGPELFSKWVGESEKAVRDVFRKARGAAPSIIFFDEIDAIAVERGSGGGGGSGVGDRVLAQLLTELDGVEGLNGVNIVAATNRPDMIDKALMRPGRLDRLVYVPLPDSSTRQDIFAIRLADVPLSGDVNMEELVTRTEMYSGAEVTAVCNEAAMAAMQEDIDNTSLSLRHFETALSCVKPQTTPQMVQYYENYSSETKT